MVSKSALKDDSLARCALGPTRVRGARPAQTNPGQIKMAVRTDSLAVERFIIASLPKMCPICTCKCQLKFLSPPFSCPIVYTDMVQLWKRPSRDKRYPMTEGDQSQIKRQLHRRRLLNTPLIVMQDSTDSGRKSFFGYAKNISAGGMFIASINPPEPGSRFQVEFSMPGSQSGRVECTCEVVWKRLYTKRGPYEPGMGLKFLEIQERSVQAIDTWVQAPQA
jgi:uncharacterized protein (TIGR02266 family)